MLKDKILETARVYIEKHEGVPATVERWRLISVQRWDSHRLIASITVCVGDPDSLFDVWVVVDLDTEEMACI